MSIIYAAEATNLPQPVSSLIAREREIADVRRLLCDGRLVTLTGPGGVGKTRLALAVAHAVASCYPNGVLFVDLSPLDDSARVVAAIAQAAQVHEAGDRPLLARLADALRSKRALLVLDNVERVMDATPDIAWLLEQAATISVLATSRARLKLRGERDYPTPPLPVGTPDTAGAAPAVELFVERARRAARVRALTRDSTGGG